METEKRTVRFDRDLQVEAYHFQGIMQKFPNHFHEHYVIGFVEGGHRQLSCGNKTYTINPGDMILFNPLDNHTCEQIDDRALDWRCLNIEIPVMRRIAEEITGIDFQPVFTPTVVCSAGSDRSDTVLALKEVHTLIMTETKGLNKEETFSLLMAQLFSDHTESPTEEPVHISRAIQTACTYMKANYQQNITLAELSEISKLNKYTLLRHFTVQRGITPYQYLSTIRVNKAKELLEGGTPPLEAALESGFTDQSHFTRFFKNFIGLTPKLYQDIYRGKRT
ncbi:MAG: AraC family transcriptional regulator [Spirochaetaceae bacterium]|jgi:AraC-like DNA-binding protein|nr:AraC family transcriptional regulator [Spirochaetaceae bacterium]